MLHAERLFLNVGPADASMLEPEYGGGGLTAEEAGHAWPAFALALARGRNFAGAVPPEASSAMRARAR